MKKEYFFAVFVLKKAFDSISHFITIDFEVLRFIYFNRTSQTVQFALNWMVNYLNPIAYNIKFHKDPYYDYYFF